MMRLFPPLLALGLWACGSSDTRPAWGTDQIVLAPADGGEATATQTWTLHNAHWARTGSDDDTLCDVTVVYDLATDTPEDCPACVTSFVATRVTVTKTDCESYGWTALPSALRSLRGLAIGAPNQELTDPPVSYATGSWVRFEDDPHWLIYGWAWAKDRTDVKAWDGRTAFQLESAYDTPLTAPASSGRAAHE